MEQPDDDGDDLRLRVGDGFVSKVRDLVDALRPWAGVGKFVSRVTSETVPAFLTLVLLVGSTLLLIALALLVFAIKA